MLGGLSGRKCESLRCRLSLKQAIGIRWRGEGGMCGHCRLGGADPSRKENRKSTKVSSMFLLQNEGGDLSTPCEVAGHRG